MEILEEFLQGKNKLNIGCEDGYFINDNFVVVVDGATSKKQCLWEGKASGEFAKDLIIETVKSIKAETKCNQFFETLHVVLKAQFCRNPKVPVSEQLRASMLVYSNYYHEIWCLGDCNYMVNGILYDNGKKVDILIAEIRSMLIQSLLAEGKTEEELLERDISREAILPFIDRQYYLENLDCEYGYPELNSASLNYDMIRQIKVNAGDCIIFATDGYPELKGTLAESEVWLERQLREDPLCYKLHKSTKGLNRDMISFDDRCFVKFRV